MQQRLYDDQSSLRLILLGNLNFNMSLLCLYVLNSSTSEQAKNVRQMVLGEHHYHLTFFEIFRYGIILSKKPFEMESLFRCWAAEFSILLNIVIVLILDQKHVASCSTLRDVDWLNFVSNTLTKLEILWSSIPIQYEAVCTCLYQVMDKISTSNW